MKHTGSPKYNPGFLSANLLVDSYSIRQAALNYCLEKIHENKTESNQHLLLIGPRGSGKTTLALRAAAEFQIKDSQKKNWHPILFGEESYEIFTPGEFWLEALRHLAEAEADFELRKVYEELLEEQNEERLHNAALATLMNFADKKKKRLLLVVENINMILTEQFEPDDAWTLRHTLQNENRIMLLATAVTRFDEIQNVDKAFYELFQIYELRPLKTEECCKLWQRISGQKISKIRIRPIEILTGGNPRLIVLLAEFAAESDFRQLMENLTHLIDERTDYFKSNIESLPPVERKIFSTLAVLWDPSPASEVARCSRLNVNKTSSLLGRLEKRGAVQVVKTEGRTKFYQLTERLYNIYHLMRKRGAGRDRVMAVVRYMTDFYEEQELTEKTRDIVEEALKLEPTERGEHFAAYEGILERVGSEMRRRIMLNTPFEFFKADDFEAAINIALNTGNPILKLAASYTIVTNEPDKAIKILQQNLSSIATNGPKLNTTKLITLIEIIVVTLAAKGHENKLLTLFQTSDFLKKLEPLHAGLQIHSGSTPTAPQEILEIGEDIARKITTLTRGLQQESSANDAP